jgi:predicted RNA-binding protein
MVSPADIALRARNEKETLIMEAVDRIEPQGDGLQLVNIFGDQKFTNARIHALSLVDHRVFLKK